MSVQFRSYYNFFLIRLCCKKYFLLSFCKGKYLKHYFCFSMWYIYERIWYFVSYAVYLTMLNIQLQVCKKCGKQNTGTFSIDPPGSRKVENKHTAYLVAGESYLLKTKNNITFYKLNLFLILNKICESIKMLGRFKTLF